jgi:hypothetical protein
MTSAGTDPAGGHLLQRDDYLDKTSVMVRQKMAPLSAK